MEIITNKFYVYAYLDPRKLGKYVFEKDSFKIEFEYEPFYIGKGKHKRSKEHINEARNIEETGLKINKNNFPNINLHKIHKILKIQRTGHSPIVIKIQCDLSEKEAFVLETKHIQTIGRHNLKKGPLTNLTDGGEGTSNILYSNETRQKMSKAHIGKKQPQNVRDKIKKNNAKYWLGKKLSITSIDKMILSVKNTMQTKEYKNNRQPYITSISKPIFQYDLNSKLLNEFQSMRDAEIQTGVKRIGISKCCKGTTRQAGGFMWRYKETSDGCNEIKKTLFIEKKLKPVIQYDINGFFIQEFPSIKSAKLKTGAIHIIRCCKDNSKTSGGFRWKYKSDVTKELKKQRNNHL